MLMGPLSRPCVDQVGLQKGFDDCRRREIDFFLSRRMLVSRRGNYMSAVLLLKGQHECVKSYSSL